MVFVSLQKTAIELHIVRPITYSLLQNLVDLQRVEQTIGGQRCSREQRGRLRSNLQRWENKTRLIGIFDLMGNKCAESWSMDKVLILSLFLSSKVCFGCQLLVTAFRQAFSIHAISKPFHPTLVMIRLWRVGLFDFGSGSGRVWPKSSGFGFGFGYCAYYGLKANSLVILCNSILCKGTE